MDLLSKLFAVLKKILKTVFKFIGKLFKKLWPILLIVGLILFVGPAAISYLGSIGAPTWLTTGLATIVSGTLTAFTAVWGWLGAGFSALGTAAASWDLATWGLVAGGTALLLAPEETIEFIQEGVELITDVVGGVITGALSSPLGLLLLGVGAYFLFFRRKETQTDVIQVERQSPLAASDPELNLNVLKGA